MQDERKHKKGKGFLIFLLVFILAIGLFVFLGWNKGLQYSFYHVQSDKVSRGENIRVVALSDLHNASFGYQNETLLEKVKAVEPDLIILAGDFVDWENPDVEGLIHLCESFLEIAPVIYGIGNHECGVIYIDKIQYHIYLEEMGIPVLQNGSVTLEINGTQVDIGGITTGTDEYDVYSRLFVDTFQEVDTNHLKIMISHFPNLYYEKMADIKVDLNLSGHFHGGLIQIPYIGGIYSVNEGLFPKYCSGEFKLSNSKLIVSRGLTDNGFVPRIWNDPEIVVIDINQRLDLN